MFTENEMRKRLHSVRSWMAQNGFDGLFVSHPANVRYLSGFRGEPATLWIDSDRAHLLTSFRSERWAREQTQTFKVLCEDDPAGHVLAAAGSAGSRVGVDHSISHRRLKALRLRWKKIEVEPVDGIESFRHIKSEAEITLLRESQAINERIFEQILAQIRPGISERAAQGFALTAMATEESIDRPAFDPIVAAGANAWEIHHQPDKTILREGDMVIIDLGVVYRGYASDMTRTVCLGKPSATMREIYETVRRAQLVAMDTMKNGSSAHAADTAARKIIDAAGHGRSFTHGLGHGIGLETHDAGLRISPNASDFELRAGMALTVEPGLYIENQFGIRIEDTVVVRENGIDNLTSTTHELIEIPV